jgi:hypothetical protein
MKRIFMTTTAIGFITINNNSMSYEIVLAGQALQYVHITSLMFNSRKVWKIEFHDGKEAVLYKCSNEWMQRIEDNLEISSVAAIGKYIDGSVDVKV